MPTVIKIPTWRCPDCDYVQDFDPFDEDNKRLMKGVPQGECRACFRGMNPQMKKMKSLMVKEVDPKKKTTITICDESDIDAKNVTEERKQQWKKQRLADLAKFKAMEEV